MPHGAVRDAAGFFLEKMIKFDVLRDLVPFVQFKKREKHQWGSVTFNKVAGYITNDQKWAKIAPEYGFSTF